MRNMTKEEIIELLVQRGYMENNAKLVAEEILTLHPSLQPLWEHWVNDPTVCDDFEAEGFSIRFFMEKQRMAYPAALLSVDWILKEPEAAVKSIKKTGKA